MLVLFWNSTGTDLSLTIQFSGGESREYFRENKTLIEAESVTDPRHFFRTTRAHGDLSLENMHRSPFLDGFWTVSVCV